MSEKRFSGWAMLVIVLAVLAVSGVAVAGGVFVGFQLGRASEPRTLLPRIIGPRFGTPYHFFEQPLPHYFEQPMPHQFEAPPQQTVDRAYLGVAFQTLTPELAEQHHLSVEAGAWITAVIDGSPAQQAELQVGDVIVTVEGRQVTGSRTLADIIGQFEPGDEVKLEIQRGPRSLETEVELGQRPAHDRLIPEFEN